MEHLLGAEGPLIEKEEQDQEIRTLRKVPVPSWLVLWPFCLFFPSSMVGSASPSEVQNTP